MSHPIADRPARPPFGSPVSRRAFGGVVATTLLATLAACGDGSGGSAAPASGESGAGYPVSVDHKYGTTKITATPRRVVAVGLTEQDALLALGVVPVATTKWFGENPGEIWPWAKAKL